MLYTTEYYARRHINYKTAGGLGYTILWIFTPTGTGGYLADKYERNNRTGYCKDYFTGKRISAARFSELEATCKPAF